MTDVPLPLPPPAAVAPSPPAAHGDARAASISQAGELRSARIESLRALAALAVLVSHVFGVSRSYDGSMYATFWGRALLGGGFGVYVFFALTGYLIFLPFARRLAGGRRVSLAAYARNRAVRVLPLYYVVLVTLLVLREGGGTASQWLRFGFLAQNFWRDSVATVDGPMWSLVVEVHFYVLVPVLAVVLAKVAGPARWRAAAALGALGLASALLRVAFVTGKADADPRLLYNLPTTFLFFVPGMWLALLRTGLDAGTVRLPAAWARPAPWVALAAAGWVTVFWDYRTDPVALPLACLGTVGAVVLPLQPGAVTRMLSWRPLAALGVASYSLYLWHLPILEVLSDRAWAPHGFVPLLGLLTAVSTLAAAASYRLLEAPFLRRRVPWGASDAPKAAGT